jgi:hypothetical protein
MVGSGVAVALTRVGFGRYDCREQALRVSATISSKGAMATARLTLTWYHAPANRSAAGAV